jgi:thiosulfate/3-mercaptopyruvate sulfurtransferase
MNKKTVYLVLILLAMQHFAKAQNPFEKDPWRQDELMEPASLAKLIKDDPKVKILNIGVMDDIQGATHIGAASEAPNLKKLKKTVAGFAKNSTIVLYCGCCPMGKCPNIRPAFLLLKKANFTNVFLLNLPHNLHKDWFEQGYPLAQK